MRRFTRIAMRTAKLRMPFVSVVGSSASHDDVKVVLLHGVVRDVESLAARVADRFLQEPMQPLAPESG